MKIFCDGVFDLFHEGHVKHFKKIKDLYPKSTLFVGVFNDKDSTTYKRKPYYTETQRLSLVKACKYVDDATVDYPGIMTEEFINDNNIDLIVHAFSNRCDFEKQTKYFEVPVRLKKMKIIDYNEGISTTKIIKDIYSADSFELPNKSGWNKIWELKGNEETNELGTLNGYENTEFDVNYCYKHMVIKLDIKPTNKILEVGCGAGQFSELFSLNFDYYGIDYSRSLVNRNILLTQSKVFNCEANNIPFKPNYFEYSFSIGVFEYFPSKEYAYNVLNEMERMTTNSVYILNIRTKTHEEKQSKHKYEGDFQHLTYVPEDFIKMGYTICEATYEKENRFSAFKSLN